MQRGRPRLHANEQPTSQRVADRLVGFPVDAEVFRALVQARRKLAEDGVIQRIAAGLRNPPTLTARRPADVPASILLASASEAARTANGERLQRAIKAHVSVAHAAIQEP